MARWEETLDHQLDLIRSLASKDGHDYVEGWASSVMGEAESGKATGWAEKDGTPAKNPLSERDKRYARQMYGDLPDRLSAMTFNAEPVYVDPDVMTVIEAATKGFEPEPLQPEDLITDAGFMWFPRAIERPDVHGKNMSYRAVLWHPMEVQHREERTGALIRSSSGIFVALFHYRRDTDDYTDLQAEKRAGDIILTHAVPWGFGDTYDGFEAGMTGVARVVQCTWRLMQQTLSVRTTERAPKMFRRRWERANLPEKRVTVVRLRRPATERDANHEPGTVEWSHRWIVGGHWRWQWYPTQDARVCGHVYADGRVCDKFGGIHRQIFISPFVKGPEELPLEVRKTRVFEFVR